MTTLTTNLFAGRGPGTQRLAVTSGHWPDDVEGHVFIVGPDKREPGGHWFAEQGLIERIAMRTDDAGRIVVDHARVDTTIERIRRRVPWLFRRVAFMELSPFGVSNFANTNVAHVDGRLFLGYDAGRPIEIDPDTLRVITPVGANDEWLQGVPGLLEPLVAVAAHPAVDVEERSLYFVNYNQVGPPGESSETYVARWDLHGPVRRWRIDGMSPFDSIHDIKASEHHLVFSDLPFVIEPDAFRGAPRTQRNQEHTTLWIVPRAALESTPPGGTVRAVEVTLPMPTGHLLVDHEEADGNLRVVLQHIPLSDLMISMDTSMTDHLTGDPIGVDHEGLIALALQPSVIGRYEIDPKSGEVLEAELAIDEERVWGGILATSDIHHPEARRRQRQLWYAGIGFDPELVPQPWWDLYCDAADAVVAPADLPTTPVPGSIARIDLESMKVAEVYSYDDGAFASPPTFVPRSGAVDPDDGYVVVVVHRDGPKEVQVFDAMHIADGPLACATADDFNPSLLLHSTWMPNDAPRSSSYRVALWRDVVGAIKGIPGVLRSLLRMASGMRRQRRG